jgi:hypothetical protein
VIHRAVEAVDTASDVGRRELGEHRVAWGAADAFARTIDCADRQHVHPLRRQGNERTREG